MLHTSPTSTRGKRTSLYPNQWGSGREILDLELQAFSYECVSYPDHKLRFSDKIVLSSQTLRHISRLKLPFPLYFHVAHPKGAVKRRKDGETCRIERKLYLPKGQYCGVMEFTAPANTVYMPKWIMKRLKVKEGEFVHLMSVSSIPQGTYVKLQADSMKVVDVLSRNGPKHFLESTLRTYTALSAKQRIMIEHEGQVYGLTVLKTRPNSRCVSILGAGDLEVEFAEPKDTTPIATTTVDEESTRQRSDVSYNNNNNAVAHLPIAAIEDEDDVQQLSGDFSNMGWATNTESVAEGANTSNIQYERDAWFKGKGYSLEDDSLAPPPPQRRDIERKQCNACQKWIPTKNFTVHTVHCARALQRCRVCSKRVPSSKLKEHMMTHETVECSDCGESVERGGDHDCSSANSEDKVPDFSVCDICGMEVLHSNVSSHRFECKGICGDCGEEVKYVDRQHHQQTQCSHRQIACSFCQLSFRACNFDKHNEYCGNRTEQCAECGQWIKMRHMDTHKVSGCAPPLPPVMGDDAELMQMEDNLVRRLNDHTLSSSLPLKTTSSSSAKPKRPTCHHCGVRCRNSETLQDHVLRECKMALSTRIAKVPRVLNPVRPGSGRVRSGRRSSKPGILSQTQSFSSQQSLEALERARQLSSGDIRITHQQRKPPRVLSNNRTNRSRPSHTQTRQRAQDILRRTMRRSKNK